MKVARRACVNVRYQLGLVWWCTEHFATVDLQVLFRIPRGQGQLLCYVGTFSGHLPGTESRATLACSQVR
jgi:hypothetical protein